MICLGTTPIVYRTTILYKHWFPFLIPDYDYKYYYILTVIIKFN